MSAVFSRPRHYLVLALLLLAGGALMVQAVYLHTLRTQFLKGQGDARALRTVSINAHRGMLLDRNGEPLAISAPVDSVWVVPEDFRKARQRWPELAHALGLDPTQLSATVAARADTKFAYLRRAVPPEMADAALALKLPGVYRQRGYRRYYPLAEAAGHVVGYTDIDDHGQGGLEAAYDGHLRGTPGKERIVLDARRQRVALLETIAPPRPGKDLRLSIDRRIQYLAYRELKAAVLRHKAASGMAVMLDVASGEVLAMVNQPTFNPNDRADQDPDRRRNRAVTDPFEPGSTIKPFTVAAALAHRSFDPHRVIDTSPGYLRVARHTVRDVHNYGALDMAGVIRKSSNVGAVQIGLSMTPAQMWESFARFGFGVPTSTGFPGEASGLLRAAQSWRQVEQVTMAFGYGVSGTALQLARAYAALASGGLLRPVSFLAVPASEQPAGERALPADVAAEVNAMLEGVVGPGGTATKAAIAGYRVAGKTGTTHIAAGGSYDRRRYLATFAGFAPVSNPRLVLLVSLRDPQGAYYGGEVAAPVFQSVMAGALRMLGVAPDALPAAPLIPPTPAATPNLLQAAERRL
ncbi:penicillin-binding protein 2 [Immundisolibacter sp.]|uniref:peptidoglycan D,D-transpeptidase FtsI family protein n=1 Tax=Immundisolibacter sp. TaxID=1934948 RepID=UPI002B154DBB|nr:penicillin-binding protein 2 [Immundisolibacter sp.]MEA3220086.1 Peptidoglycan D,D-transpeptidase FtsI [Immundisolibacter sp.]